MRVLVLVVAAVLILATAGATTAPDEPPSPCPGQSRAAPRTANHDAQTTLVPRGASSVLLCRYAGLNAGAKKSALSRSVTVTSAATIARLTRELDGLPRLSNGIHCPFDDGSAIVAIFRYRHAADDRVRVGLKGCLVVSSGSVTRTAASTGGAALIRQLERLLAR